MLENRNRPEGRRVSLPVVIFHSSLEPAILENLNAPHTSQALFFYVENRSRFYEFPAVGHGAMREAEPDTTCLRMLALPDFE